MAGDANADVFMTKVVNGLRLYNDKNVRHRIDTEEMLDDERQRLRHIESLIDKFKSNFEGRSFSLLSSPECKLQIWKIMSEIKEQTQKWKLFGIIILNPLDLTIHVRKYMGKVSLSQLMSRLIMSHNL